VPRSGVERRTEVRRVRPRCILPGGRVASSCSGDGIQPLGGRSATARGAEYDLREGQSAPLWTGSIPNGSGPRALSALAPGVPSRLECPRAWSALAPGAPNPDRRCLSGAVPLCYTHLTTLTGRSPRTSSFRAGTTPRASDPSPGLRPVGRPAGGTDCRWDAPLLLRLSGIRRPIRHPTTYPASDDLSGIRRP